MASSATSGNHAGHESTVFSDEVSENAQRAYEHSLKMSVRTVLATMFLSSMGFTICIPSLWLYFSHFEECRCHVSLAMSTPHEAVLMMLPAATHGVEPHRFGVSSAMFSAANMNSSSSGACTDKNPSDDVRMCKERSRCNKFSGAEQVVCLPAHARFEKTAQE
jgi:hypothetical protein